MGVTHIKHKLFCAVAIGAFTFIQPAEGEEGGNGHYFPGNSSTVLDSLTTRRGWSFLSASLYNPSSFDFPSPVDARVESKLLGTGLYIFYDSDWKLFNCRYHAGIVPTYGSLEVTARSTLPGQSGIKIKDRATGWGDLLLYPLALNWTNATWNIGGVFGIYAPTGEFEADQLANLGKNFWTFEPQFYAEYLNENNGADFMASFGFDFNTTNEKIDYHSGHSLHAELSYVQHTPWGIGLGANGFYYQQLTGDSGEGAVLGGFRSHSTGIGPVLQYVTKLNGKVDFLVEFKWLPDLNTSNRLKGDYFWLKAAVVF